MTLRLGELPLEAFPNNVWATCHAGSVLLFDMGLWIGLAQRYGAVQFEARDQCFL